MLINYKFDEEGILTVSYPFSAENQSTYSRMEEQVIVDFSDLQKQLKPLFDEADRVIKEKKIIEEWEGKGHSTRHKANTPMGHRLVEDELEKQNNKDLMNYKPLQNIGSGEKPSRNISADKEIGVKETEGKLHYELSWEFIEEMAKRMANNKSEKYPPYNWKNKINIQDLKDAINRHHIEVMKGNYKDGDEVLGHVISYACNAMMLWEQLKDR